MPLIEPHPCAAKQPPVSTLEPPRLILVAKEPDDQLALGQIVQNLGPAWEFNSYASPEEAFRSVSAKPPTAVFLDLDPPVPSALEWVHRLKSLSPNLARVVVAARADAPGIGAAFAAGATGYLVKPLAPDEIAWALTLALRGEVVLCQRTKAILRQCLSHWNNSALPARLTPCEERVMGGLLKDKLDKEIADETGTSFKTVRTHVENIFQKLGVHGRAAACAAYLTRKLSVAVPPLSALLMALADSALTEQAFPFF